MNFIATTDPVIPRWREGAPLPLKSQKLVFFTRAVVHIQFDCAEDTPGERNSSLLPPFSAHTLPGLRVLARCILKHASTQN